MELRPFIGDWQRSIKCKHLFIGLFVRAFFVVGSSNLNGNLSILYPKRANGKIRPVHFYFHLILCAFFSLFPLYDGQLIKLDNSTGITDVCDHQWAMVRFRISGCGSMQHQKNKSVCGIFRIFSFFPLFSLKLIRCCYDKTFIVLSRFYCTNWTIELNGRLCIVQPVSFVNHSIRFNGIESVFFRLLLPFLFIVFVFFCLFSECECVLWPH